MSWGRAKRWKKKNKPVGGQAGASDDNFSVPEFKAEPCKSQARMKLGACKSTFLAGRWCGVLRAWVRTTGRGNWPCLCDFYGPDVLTVKSLGNSLEVKWTLTKWACAIHWISLESLQEHWKNANQFWPLSWWSEAFCYSKILEWVTGHDATMTGIFRSLLWRALPTRSHAAVTGVEGSKKESRGRGCSVKEWPQIMATENSAPCTFSPLFSSFCFILIDNVLVFYCYVSNKLPFSHTQKNTFSSLKMTHIY